MGKFENNKMFKITNCLTEPIENVYFLYEHAMQEYIIYRPKLLALSDEMKEIEILCAEKVRANGRYDLVVTYTDAFISISPFFSSAIICISASV